MEDTWLRFLAANILTCTNRLLPLMGLQIGGMKQYLTFQICKL